LQPSSTGASRHGHRAPGRRLVRLDRSIKAELAAVGDQADAAGEPATKRLEATFKR
jgi:hypothetical protein